ncbi:hypothetical protein IFT48_02825 [Pseudomonas fluorescens]|uniref:hypothetical protein n=1 Tax=Pseudomonas TaxID=286 RepID=UPI000F03E55A|nr:MULTISPECIES: hypothetical protein [Pseudomonas]MBD8088900.1 hypothetical protein [Pseudomonas fluorescens]MBD8681679.1 hypothetical protein [Pseudomonas sp. CFBP 13719]
MQAAAIVFSQEAVNQYHGAGFTPAVMASTVGVEFQTQDELQSFLEGVGAIEGVEAYELGDTPPDASYSMIAFGDDDSDFQASDFVKVEHGSVALKKAYEGGLEAGDGWLAHHVLWGEELTNYEIAARLYEATVSQDKKPAVDDSPSP